MPDLSPDLSPYQALSKPPAGGSMDLGSLLSIVGRSRELQTQSAIADALRANPDDPQSALKSVLANPNAFPTAETVSNFAHAAGAQFELNRGYMREAAGAMGSLFSKPNATVDDFTNITPLLRQYHVPQAMIDDVLHSASTNGILDHDKLIALRNWVEGNAGFPTSQVRGAGFQADIPQAGTLYGRQPGSQPPTSPPPLPPPRPTASGGGTGKQQQPAAADPADEAESEVKRMYSGYGAGAGATVNPSQAVQDTWASSAREYSAERGRDYQADTTPIRKALDILAKNPNATGRGLTEFNNVKNMLHSMGFIKDDNMKDVVDFETLGKHFANLANSGSMSETDARLFQTIMGSASPDKLGDTNKAVLRFALALRNMHQAALSEFRGRVGPGRMAPEYFSDWRNSWAAKQDPMAFAWDTMSKEEQQRYGDEHFTGNDHGVWQTFEASLNAARRNGASK